MSTTLTPLRPKKVNRLGLEVINYKGGKTTLCAGCGHNSISERIIEASTSSGSIRTGSQVLAASAARPRRPLTSWGCRTASTAVHGRMPAMATGAMLANQHPDCIGVSGDGDTASIGMGQFMHLVRRNLPMIYIIENNGVYGLTKGQFSATADFGSTRRPARLNDLPPFDCCALAMKWGATSSRARSAATRSSSGDAEDRDRA